MTKVSSDFIGDDGGDFARRVDGAESPHFVEPFCAVDTPSAVHAGERFGEVVAFAQIPEVGVGILENFLFGHLNRSFESGNHLFSEVASLAAGDVEIAFALEFAAGFGHAFLVVANWREACFAYCHGSQGVGQTACL